MFVFADIFDLSASCAVAPWAYAPTFCGLVGLCAHLQAQDVQTAQIVALKRIRIDSEDEVNIATS
jgi:hypothetical protein